jgi:NTP pyrophosphatase (non-canonical NTP hydrolase)
MSECRITWTGALKQDEVQRRQVLHVLHERNRQDEKWGEQNHTPEWWLAILMEEVGELSQAVLETHFTNPDGSPHGGLKSIRKETMQVCAVALAMLECFDRRGDKACKREDEKP